MVIQVVVKITTLKKRKERGGEKKNSKNSAA